MTDLTNPRRIVEIVGDRWIQPGVLVHGFGRVIRVRDGRASVLANAEHMTCITMDLSLPPFGPPDLTDPATWGVLLSLLPEGWQIFREHKAEGYQWMVIDEDGDDYMCWSFPTKFDALIAALEASHGQD